MGAGVDRDVALGGKNNGERGGVRGNDIGKSKEDGLAGENGETIDGDNKSANELAADIADVRRRGAGSNSREVATFADVAGSDLKPQGRVATCDVLGDRVKAVKGVVGHREV